jgi:hypothetical protein
MILGLGLLGLGVAMGLPRLLYEHSRDARARDYAQVRGFLAKGIHGDDWLLADPALYYAAKEQGVPFFSLTYGGGRGYPVLSEAGRINVAIVRPEDLALVEEKVPGVWRPTGAQFSTRGLVVRSTDIHGIARYYELAVYRKESVPDDTTNSRGAKPGKASM